MTTPTVTPNLRTLLARGTQLVAPGAADALSARHIEAHGSNASTSELRDCGGAVRKARYRALVVERTSRARGIHHRRGAHPGDRGCVRAIHIEDHTGAGKHTTGPQTLHSREAAAERIRAAVRARKNPDLLIVARSDAFWVHRDLDDCIARLNAYVAAGADMVFPTLVGQAELAEVRRRVAKPVMIVNNAAGQHDGAAIVLYYAFSVVAQFDAVQRALADGRLAADTRPLEDFLGYKDAEGRNQ